MRGSAANRSITLPSRVVHRQPPGLDKLPSVSSYCCTLCRCRGTVGAMTDDARDSQHRRRPHRGRAQGRPHPRPAPAAGRAGRVRRGAPTSSRSPAGTRSSSCVGNATQTAHYYQSAWGMELEAYSGPETGNRDHKSFVLRSGSIRFVVNGAVDPDSPLVDHHRKHGDGVVDIALEVPDVDRCIAQARKAGATRRPRARGRHRRARHRPDRRHRDVRRDPAHARRPRRGTTAPTCRATSPRRRTWVKREGQPKRLFQALDHIVGNVELGQMDEWVQLLQPGDGLREHGGVHRRRHRHRLLRADVARWSPTATTG